MKNESQLLVQMKVLNASEQFYKAYAEAKASSEYALERFLASLDKDKVLKEHLLVPEWKETIPPEYLEEWYFDLSKKQSIYVWKHNCYTPALMHHHNFFELFYVLEGSCRHVVGPSNTVLTAGDCCLIQPGIQHSIDVSDESIVVDILIRTSTFKTYFFNVLRGDNILSAFFLSNLYAQSTLDYIIFHAGGDDAIRSLIIESYGEFAAKNTYYMDVIQSLLTQLFAKLLRSHEATCELPPYRHPKAQKALAFVRFIQDNYTNVTLESLSSAFHYTPEYTSRVIHSLTGFTFTQLLTQVRLEQSCELLQDTNASISTIAFQIGYMNPEHFIRTFKKAYGMTPKAYRQKNG